MAYKIGIDVGGTFTDFLLTDDDGTSYIYKTLSTPKDPSIATIRGIEEMAADRGMPTAEFLDQVSTIVHGTTVTTNATLTYRGAKTGLLTTEGVRDALEMRRGIREEQYNNHYENARPVVERYLRRPVVERLDYAGDVITPLDEASVRRELEFMKGEDVKAVAVCFMNSFANPAHELRAAEIVREMLPDAFLSVSAEVLPAIRFYDRVSTTALNAYIGPVLELYLGPELGLLKKLSAFDYRGVLLIMASNGGVISPEVSMRIPGLTLLSGPAGGPVAGLAYADGQGFADTITCDMGGTSFDVALIKDRKPLTTTEGEINRLRISWPMLDVVTIGAGGGSIGWIDEVGLLRMGPQSAGADPGPACYGLGGTEPTCSDADLVLGYLDPDFFAGGKIKLDVAAARKAVEDKIATRMGMTVEEAAAGMYEVINVGMAAAVREIAVKAGYDPRDFPLVTAGGAGPNHACMIALALSIPEILVPKESSIFCAAGMLRSDLKHDFVRTYPITFDKLDWDRFRALFAEMKAEGASLLDSEGIPQERISYHLQLDLRYIRQYHEVAIDISFDEVEAGASAAIEHRFHATHDALYGYSLEDRDTPVELINMRLTAVGDTEKPSLVPEQYAGADPSAAFKRVRTAYIPTEKASREIPVYDGFGLKFGNRLTGPCIIEQVNTTTFVTPEFDVVVDGLGTYTIYQREREAAVLERVLGITPRRGGGMMVSQDGGAAGAGPSAAAGGASGAGPVGGAPGAPETLVRNGIAIDRILVSILQKRLKSITEEMSIAMVRTTRSPILCEARDFVTGLYDANGDMLEQKENLPILAFSLQPVCKYILQYFGDDIHEGDVIFHNDVFSMGNQNNDVAVYKPIFFEGELVAWSAVKGHQADIGGNVRGGYNPQATEVWQESLRIPPVKVYDRGVLRKDVWDLIFANVRLDMVAEDMRAEIGSCVVGERGIHRILERYGREVFEAHKEYLFDSTEQMMRNEIRSIPQGTYTGESYAYYDGKNPGSKYKIHVDITVGDGEIRFDYHGTDAQTPGFVNGTYTSSASACLLTFLQMINPDIPHNAGLVRPVVIDIPEGTILNAAYPAATTYGNHLCPNNADAIMRALGPVIPERVTAEWNELLCSQTTGLDTRPGKEGMTFVDIGFMGLKGGSGGIYGADGYDHIGMIDASGGVLDQDYEIFEQVTPHRVVRHEFWEDSAGAGRWRGGIGVETELVLEGRDLKVVTFGDGDVEPSRGSLGGTEGALNIIQLKYPGEAEWRTLTTKDLVQNVPTPTGYFQQAGGGGGWGDPKQRPADKVLRDVRNGVVSLEKARRLYGVAIDDDTWTVDEADTARLRGTGGPSA